jgi:hypothetical protein
LENVIKYGILSVPVGLVALSCIKISVACLILKFLQNRIEKIFLYVLIGVLASTHFAFILVDLLQCFPLSSAWNLTIQNPSCISHTTYSRVSNTSTGITIATDIILSLFPITFLRQVRRPLMEKVLIGVLMSMGLAAAGVSIAKTVVVKVWAANTDSIAVGARISMLTCLEQFIGITAACSPSFKPTISKLLASLGITFNPKNPATNAPEGPLQEFNTHSNGTIQSKVFSFSEMEDLSKESTKIGVEGLGSGSEQGSGLSRGTEGSHQPGDVV